MSADPHDGCLADALRFYEEKCNTQVTAAEEPDHTCIWYASLRCKPHDRTVWTHPTAGQFLAWELQGVPERP